jgi:hypothetical protein
MQNADAELSSSKAESADTQFKDAQPSDDGIEDTSKRCSRARDLKDDGGLSPTQACYIQGTHLVAGGWFQACRCA